MATRKEQQARPVAGRRHRRWLALVATVAGIATLIWGLVWLGDEARRGIGPRERYTVRFADIQCEPPAGMDRAAFLAEVRYVAGFPETVQALDPDLSTRLAAAFTMHPWVAALESVFVSPDGSVRVQLRYRVPALQIRLPNDTVRYLDTEGVLLPRDAKVVGVPILVTSVTDGSDPVARRALELLSAHHPQTLERTPVGWRLTMADGKVLHVEK